MGFPFRIFLRYVLSQFFVFNALLLVVLGLLVRSGDIAIAQIGPIFWPFFGGSVVFALITSYRFTSPLRKLLRKVMGVASKKYAKLWGGEEMDLFVEEPGEFSDFYTALDRIDKKLKKRKDQLVREREETMAFMSSVREGLLSANSSGRIQYFNSQFAALFLSSENVKSEEGMTLAEVIRVPEVLEAFRRVVENGETQKVVTRIATQLDRQPRDFAISMTALRKDKSPEIRGVIGIFHDVTDLRKAERVRIEFVGNASHELRTPLTSIKGYLDTLREDIHAGRMEQVPSFLEVISRNLTRLIDLVNDLLSLSSLENNPELKLEPVNALLITDQVVKEFAALAAEKRIVLRVSGDVPDFPADMRKVEQVLRNLIANAIKYIPEGKSIHIRWSLNEKHQVVLIVADDGPGIAPEHHDRLFERFYRVDKGRSRDNGGTGLGLAIVKHIMQSHGGSVQLRSELGNGSEFICVFPSSQGGRGGSPRS